MSCETDRVYGMCEPSHRSIAPLGGPPPAEGIRIQPASSSLSGQYPATNLPIQTKHVSRHDGGLLLAPKRSSEHNMRFAGRTYIFGGRSESQSSESDAARRRVVQRQSHTKSRNGCYSCKRRRIKCDETRPLCVQCMKRGFQCQWPEAQIREARIPTQSGTSSQNALIQQPSANASFTMQDFRLFYYFIDRAYPHQPVGNDSVWKHEVPIIAHNHDFLLHAMLALSAADLATNEAQPSELACTAVAHRVKAIKALNQALSNGVQNFEEGNAMLATCYSLLFQSAMMEDGLAEYMTFVRGVVLVAGNMGARGLKFLFHSMLGPQQLEKMDPYLQGPPPISPEPINAAVASLEAFRYLCVRESEKRFHAVLMKTARALHTSSRDAYLGIMEIYATFSYTMSHEDFQWFINPANEIGQLLQSHFVAIQLLFSPVTLHEEGPRKAAEPTNESAHWLGGIYRNIPENMRQYVAWPMFTGEEEKARQASRKQMQEDNGPQLQLEADGMVHPAAEVVR